MKKRIFALCLSLLLVFPVMAGCQSSAGSTVESMGRMVESRAESVGETIKQSLESAAPTQSGKSRQAEPTGPAATSTEALLTVEEAQNIALEHAGFKADQVTRLHTEYELDHGVPEYEVEFHEGVWEYDYEINAQTGEILSFGKDD